jgi:hypothetical protein
MGWSIGFDDKWNRDIGYGVPAFCDHPDCNAEIDRGLGYVCCGEEPFGGRRGCGLYFCGKHQGYRGKCERCQVKKEPFTPKPDHPRWIKHKLEHASWGPWRADHRKEVAAMREHLAMVTVSTATSDTTTGDAACPSTAPTPTSSTPSNDSSSSC